MATISRGKEHLYASIPIPPWPHTPLAWQNKSAYFNYYTERIKNLEVEATWLKQTDSVRKLSSFLLRVLRIFDWRANSKSPFGAVCWLYLI